MVDDGVADTSDVRNTLVCEECKREADDRAVGWRGYLVDADNDDDQDEILFFCSRCVEREFSQ